MCWWWASMECQGFSLSHIWQSKGYIIAFFQSENIGGCNRYEGNWHVRYPILEMCVNGASMLFVLASCIIRGLRNGYFPYSKYWPPVLQIVLVTMPLPPKTSVNRASTMFGHVSKVLGSDLLTVMHKQLIGSLYRQNRKRHSRCHVHKMSVNAASMIYGLASCTIQGLCNNINP